MSNLSLKPVFNASERIGEMKRCRIHASSDRYRFIAPGPTHRFRSRALFHIVEIVQEADRERGDESDRSAFFRICKTVFKSRGLLPFFQCMSRPLQCHFNQTSVCLILMLRSLVQRGSFLNGPHVLIESDVDSSIDLGRLSLQFYNALHPYLQGCLFNPSATKFVMDYRVDDQSRNLVAHLGYEGHRPFYVPVSDPTYPQTMEEKMPTFMRSFSFVPLQKKNKLLIGPMMMIVPNSGVDGILFAAMLYALVGDPLHDRFFLE